MRAKNALKMLLALFAGLFVGALGLVMYGGPVDMPLIGLALASLMTASGLASCTAYFGARSGFAMMLAEVILTFVFLYLGPTDDAFVLPELWPSYVWSFLGPLSALVGFLFGMRIVAKGTRTPSSPSPHVSDARLK